ncbi:MAG: hypothetical protein WD757_06855 [Actinomycetota bacterium]
MRNDWDDFGGAESLTPADLHRLKMSVHRSIDEVFAAFEPRREVVPIEFVHVGDPLPDWKFSFPRMEETVSQSRVFTVRTAVGDEETPVEIHGRIGRTVRPSWGKDDRGRWVVFGSLGGKKERFYPWLEWVETDTGMVAAEAPDAVDPRRGILHDAQAPDFLEGVDLARSDELFHGISRGRSLRMVLPLDDQREMVRIAAEVARLRHRPPWDKLASNHGRKSRMEGENGLKGSS